MPHYRLTWYVHKNSVPCAELLQDLPTLSPFLYHHKCAARTTSKRQFEVTYFLLQHPQLRWSNVDEILHCKRNTYGTCQIFCFFHISKSMHDAPRTKGNLLGCVYCYHINSSVGWYVHEHSVKLLQDLPKLSSLHITTSACWRHHKRVVHTPQAKNNWSCHIFLQPQQLNWIDMCMRAKRVVRGAPQRQAKSFAFPTSTQACKTHPGLKAICFGFFISTTLTLWFPKNTSVCWYVHEHGVH